MITTLSLGLCTAALLMGNTLLYGHSLTAGITWQFRSQAQKAGKQPIGETITWQVNTDVTKITSPLSTTYLDYAGKTLYRMNNHTGTCRKFPFTTTPVGQDSKNQKAPFPVSAHYTSAPALPLQEKIILGFHCTRYQLLFDTSLTISQMMYARQLQAFGKTFRESTATWWVSRDVPLFKELLDIAVQREKNFAANPFLRQIDWVTLLTKIRGFPVQQTSKTGTQLTNLILLREPTSMTSPITLPEGCQ